MKEVKLSECGLSYAVVSIMGPQSSGMLCDLNFVSYSFHEQICCVIASTSQFALEDVYVIKIYFYLILMLKVIVY